MLLLSFLIWRRRTIQHRNMELCKIYSMQVLEDAYLSVRGFLQNRQFCMRLGYYKSDLFNQEMGVPQSSIMSVTLFALKINSVVKDLTPGMECYLYVDDFFICYRSRYMHIIERHL